MEGDHYRNDREWLNGLQREGWRMELLISGFSLVLLMKLPDKISYWQEYIDLHLHFQGGLESILIGFLAIFNLAGKVLVINLLVNIFLRGFWIGAIGLNSVQDRIDIASLGYSTRFREYLQEKVMPLDRLTQRLDEICSVVFSFSFLIVFMLLSFFLYILAGTLFNYGMMHLAEASGGIWQSILVAIGSISIFALIIFGLFYLIDTLTLGWVKRFSSISGIYMRIYRLISRITLAPLYRSIYYSLITRFSRRQVAIFLVPYLLFLIGHSYWDYDQYVLFPESKDDTNWQTNVYDDQRPEDTFIQKASIPSAWISDPFLPLFVRYEVFDNQELASFCDLKRKVSPFSIGTGASDMFVDSSRLVLPEDKARSMNCLLKYYRVTLDDRQVFTDSVKTYRSGVFWYTHPVNKERGLRLVLDIDTLSRGQHWITISKPLVQSKEPYEYEEDIRFPFWKE